METFTALISSDWNECLAPCGPFDALVFNHPAAAGAVDAIFRQYTGNEISLSTATARLQALVPESITAAQMDAYLDGKFETYRGVADLIRWCRRNRVLFMINTTGMIGYFQRVMARGLLPRVPVLAASPMLRFEPGSRDPDLILDLFETGDKARHTDAVAQAWNIAPERIILMGDSGGDGPHFEWGAGLRAHLIGCMTKPSLMRWCSQRGIAIDHFFGPVYAEGRTRDPELEQHCDFRDLQVVIEQILE